MTCPLCARDLLRSARSLTGAEQAQAIREAITEWEDPREARALTGMLARLEKLGQSPALDYWIAVAEVRAGGKAPISEAAPITRAPCGSCPGSS